MAPVTTPPPTISNGAEQWLIAIMGAFLVAFIVDNSGVVGGWLLLLVVLGILLTAQRKGFL